MRFEEARDLVLEGSRYDFLTGRRVDVGETINELLVRFFTWLFENLGFDLPEGTGGGTGLIATIFTIIAIIVAVITAYVLIRAYLRKREPKRHTIADLFEELRTHTVSELLELSRTAENRRFAVRYKYIAALLHLSENDIIVIEPSATNAIIARQIKASAPALSAPFAQIADAFHLTWFGHKNLRDENFSEFDSAIAVLTKLRRTQ